jgi:ribosomal-protein-alanine N-acetyltransferase
MGDCKIHISSVRYHFLLRGCPENKLNGLPVCRTTKVNKMVSQEPVRIREFEASDIQEIMVIEAFSAPKTSLPREMFFYYVRRYPDTFLVVESGETVAGYIVFDFSGHILSMVVKPEYRRKGFGKRLVMFAMDYLRSNLWLEVRSKNHGAVNFYKKLGMKTIGTVPNYYGNDDALIMALSKESVADRE